MKSSFSARGKDKFIFIGGRIATQPSVVLLGKVRPPQKSRFCYGSPGIREATAQKRNGLSACDDDAKVLATALS